MSLKFAALGSLSALPQEPTTRSSIYDRWGFMRPFSSPSAVGAAKRRRRNPRPE
jgi:hypothetical protein